jgi:hypothetical protein
MRHREALRRGALLLPRALDDLIRTVELNPRKIAIVLFPAFAP